MCDFYFGSTIEEDLSTEAHDWIVTYLSDHQQNYPVVTSCTKNFINEGLQDCDINDFMLQDTFVTGFFIESISDQVRRHIHENQNVKEKLRAIMALSPLDATLKHCLEKWEELERLETQISDYVEDHLYFQPIKTIIKLDLDKLKNHKSFWPVVLGLEALIGLARRRLQALGDLCASIPAGDREAFRDAVLFIQKFFEYRPTSTRFRLIARLAVPYAPTKENFATGASDVMMENSFNECFEVAFKRPKKSPEQKTKIRNYVRDILIVLFNTHSGFLINALNRMWSKYPQTNLGIVQLGDPLQQQLVLPEDDLNKLLTEQNAPKSLCQPDVIRFPDLWFTFSPQDNTVPVNNNDAGLNLLDSYARFNYAERTHQISYLPNNELFDNIIKPDDTKSLFEQSIFNPVNSDTLQTAAFKAFVLCNARFAQAVSSLEKFNMWEKQFKRVGAKKLSLGVCVYANENDVIQGVRMALVTPDGTIHPASYAFLDNLQLDLQSFSNICNRLFRNNWNNLTNADQRKLTKLGSLMSRLGIQDICIANTGWLYRLATEMITCVNYNLRVDEQIDLKFIPPPNRGILSSLGLVIHRLYENSLRIEQTIAVAAALLHTCPQQAMSLVLSPFTYREPVNKKFFIWDMVYLPYDTVYTDSTAGARVASTICSIAFFNQQKKIDLLPIAESILKCVELRNLLQLERNDFNNLKGASQIIEDQMFETAGTLWDWNEDQNVQHLLEELEIRELTAGTSKLNVETPRDKLLAPNLLSDHLYNDFQSSIEEILELFPKLDLFGGILQQHTRKLDFGYYYNSGKKCALQKLLAEVMKYLPTKQCLRVTLNAALQEHGPDENKMTRLLTMAKDSSTLAGDADWALLTIEKKNSVFLHMAYHLFKDFVKNGVAPNVQTPRREDLLITNNLTADQIKNILKEKAPPTTKDKYKFSLELVAETNTTLQSINDNQTEQFDHNHCPPKKFKRGFYRFCNSTNIHQRMLNQYPLPEAWTMDKIQVECELSLSCRKSKINRTLQHDKLTFFFPEDHEYLETNSLLTAASRKLLKTIKPRLTNENGIQTRSSIPYQFVESRVNSSVRKIGAGIMRFNKPFKFVKQHTDWERFNQMNNGEQEMRNALISINKNANMINGWNHERLPNQAFDLTNSGNRRAFMILRFREWRGNFAPIHLEGMINYMTEARMQGIILQEALELIGRRLERQVLNADEQDGDEEEYEGQEDEYDEGEVYVEDDEYQEEEEDDEDL